MKIEVKNILNELNEDQCDVFYGALYVKGTNAGIVYNYGVENGTKYLPLSKKGEDLIKGAEQYCLKLPPIIHKNKGIVTKYEMNLVNEIELQVADFILKKEELFVSQSFARDMEKNLITGIPGGAYRLYGLPFPISTMTTLRQQHFHLMEHLDDHKHFLTDGEKVLNTNIFPELLKMAGLNEDQYVKPLVPDSVGLISKVRSR